jgi:PAS domain-containing protein
VIRKLIIHDGRSERELLLAGTIVVGRDPSCHISDLDPLLSRRHAEFVAVGERVTLRDLGSRNGMLVNGAKVREHVLADGDLIQFGHLQLHYVEATAPHTPEEAVLAHATTASTFEAETMAPKRTPASDLEDTAPHAPHLHAHVPDPLVDNDVTRPHAGRTPNAPAMPGVHGPKAPADLDVTVAPTPRDPDATFVPGIPLAAKMPTDLDVTMAPTPRDPDATFVPGIPIAPTMSADLDVTMAPTPRDPDATFVPGIPIATKMPATPNATTAPAPGAKHLAQRPVVPGNLDATFAPGAGHDLDVTFVPGRADLAAALEASLQPSSPRSTPADTASEVPRLVAGTDLRVTAANAACQALFGASPDHLVGELITSLLTRSLEQMTTGHAPATLSLVIERAPADQTLTLTFNSGQTAS